MTNKFKQPPNNLQNRIVADFQKATQYHQSGQLDAAKTLYESILKKFPKHADSCHLLGLIVANQDPQQAKKLITKAIEINPNFPPYYLNRGLVFENLKNYEAAIKDYKKVLQFQPNPMAYARLGQAYLAANLFSEAEDALKRALSMQPNEMNVLNNLGTVYYHLGQHQQALNYYQQALTLNPNHPDILSNLGVIYFELKEFDKATHCYHQALALDANHIKTLSNYAMLLSHDHQYQKAEELYKQAVNLMPNDSNLINSFGVHHKNNNEVDKSLELFIKAQQLRPNYIEAEFNEALALLVKGDYINGWRKYETRFDLKERQGEKQLSNKPLWEGETNPNQTLLVRVEQGLGDTLQFIRYLPLVKQKFQGQIIFQCQKALIPLLQHQELGFDIIIPQAPYLPEHDKVTYLMSLPRIFKTTLDTIPNPQRYLKAKPSIQYPFLNTYKKRVGIVWAGGTLHKNDHNRSTKLESLLSWFENKNCQFYSFQYERNEDINKLNLQDKLFDLTSYNNTFSDTAQLLVQMDLLISVDTAMAHLGGALGIPTWIMITYSPDFRWLLNRNDSPWYDRVKVFRQQEPSSWSLVVEDVKIALQNF